MSLQLVKDECLFNINFLLLFVVEMADWRKFDNLKI